MKNMTTNVQNQLNYSCFGQILYTGDAFTFDQAGEYCASKSNWSAVISYLDAIIGYSMIISGIVGLVGSLLMLITFFHKSMSALGYLYYKAMSSAELLHMVVLIEYGVIRILHFPPSDAMRIWKTAFEYGWSLGDWVKLSVAALTVFVSVERFMAIWMPMTFAAVVDRRRAASTAVLISLGIGAVHGFTLVLFLIDLIDQSGRSYNTIFAQIQEAIGYIKLTLCVVLAPLTISIIVGLRLKSKRMSKLRHKPNGGMSAKEKEQWKSTKTRCYLQLILASSTLIDHAAWFAYRMLALRTERQSAATENNSYDSLSKLLEYKKLTDAAELVQVISGELLHCGKFYLYFLLHTGFRRSFFKVFSRNQVGASDVDLALRSNMDLAPHLRRPSAISVNILVSPVPTNQSPVA